MSFLFCPTHDCPDPRLSLVVSAMNEALTIGRFLDWCHEGIAQLAQAYPDGKGGTTWPVEIIIIDSSSDATQEIALEKGARVLKVPARGLGQAYKDAIPFIRGSYVIMGDADCTYDFRDLIPFVQAFEAGADFVMGSRFLGSIEPGAMPLLHRYFGTPLTGWILNHMYGTRWSDIHCGMRGVSLKSLKDMNLQASSWDYASEMILKASHARVKTAEVPVRFYKDQEGRESHMIRAGWLEPWRAGWRNLRSMFIFGADFFLLRPGFALFLLGSLGVALLALGPLQVFGIDLSLNSLLIALFMGTLGWSLFLAGGVARCLYDPLGPERQSWLRLFSYDRTCLISGGTFALGLSLFLLFVFDFWQAGFTYRQSSIPLNHLALAGCYLMACSIQAFVMMLLIQAVSLLRPSFSESLDVVTKKGTL